ncbi:MAG: Iron hydrogenase 1 [Firmicutes bacterium ADurb.Bin419]|nr:MAG: Iron hydrogenase 1 [Firmicutes bacterium ADurb.Bin419]
MPIENKVTQIKHSILTKIAYAVRFNRLVEDIGKIPGTVIPQNSKSFRCCIYRDREIVKHRTLGALGFSLESEAEIDCTSLSTYAKRALEREEPSLPILTFIDEACKTCVRANYFVSNICSNCVSRRCTIVCPKQAIENKEHAAFINPEKCINCGLCQKECPFHAIVYVPVPCEEACPVNAIRRNADGKQFIDDDKCISCGKCLNACPFGAVVDKSQIVDVLKNIQQGKKLVAIIAPSIVGQFEYSIDSISSKLRAIGFFDTLEVAVGADKTRYHEANEFEEKMKNGQSVMGTSCCPAYVEAVKKHALSFTTFLSHTLTPMEYTAQIVKERIPDALVAFIGPCTAKKFEGLKSENVDFVLTFEELNAIFKAYEDILPSRQEFSSVFSDIKPSNYGRGFPITNGVANAVMNLLNDKNKCKPVFIDGLDKKNIKLLSAYAKKAPGNLIEVMSCKGGCMSGPCVIKTSSETNKALNEFLKACDNEGHS